MTTAKATRPLGRWSPAGNRTETLRIATRLRNVMVRIFRAQARWMERNWQQVLTTPQRRTLRRLQAVAKQITPPRNWDGWAEPMARELTPGIGAALEAGGESAIRELNVAVDWTLRSPEAERFVQQHGLNLAKGLNRTTTVRLRGIVARGIADGSPYAEIRNNILRSVRGMTQRRAALIAQTETVRAMNEGKLQVFDEAGVPRKKWLNFRQNHCDHCASLGGRDPIPLHQSYSDVAGRAIQGPPAHSGCQCAIRAVGTPE